MQPQLEDSVTPKSESRYRKTHVVTRFRDVKLPKPAEALQWHPWFCSLVLCAFRRKKAEHWGFLPSAEMEARLCDSLFGTGLTPEFRILLAGRTDTCHELNQAYCRHFCSQPWLYKYTDTPSQGKGSSLEKGTLGSGTFQHPDFLQDCALHVVISEVEAGSRPLAYFMGRGKSKQVYQSLD